MRHQFMRVGSGNSIFANVSLLLHMDGSNNSTTFVDSSLTPKTVTAEGNARISTAQSKFSGASGYFDGSGDRIVIANNSALDLGLNDFTVECWVYSIAGLSSYPTQFAHIFGKGEGISAGTYVLCFFEQKICWFGGSGNNTNITIASGTTILANNTWYHFAASRIGGVLRLFVNGALEASSAAAGALNYVSSKNFTAGDRTAGSVWGNYPLNGYIDEIRIIKGVGIYASSFIPPTAPFPDF